MVKHAEEQNVVKLSGDLIHIVDRAFLKFDFQAESLGSKASLIQIALIDVHSEDPACSAFLEGN